MSAVIVVHPGAELFGSDRMLLESVRGLVRSNRVVVALPQAGPLVDLLLAAGAEVVIVPILVLRKSLLQPRNWAQLVRTTMRGLVAAVRLLRKIRPTVVYVSTITVPQWPSIARVMHFPVVTHVHEAEASANIWVNRILYAPHLPSRFLVTNSEFSLSTMRGAIASLADRTTVVWNGVESPERVELARSHVDTLRIAYVGRLSPRKGPDLAIQALALLRDQGVDAELTLIGSVFSGYEWYQDRLEELVRQLGLLNFVSFTGFVADIWPLLSVADVIVVPSRLDEPFGNTAVEAVLAGRPVVASDTSGLREAVGEYKTARLVHPDNARVLADAMKTVTEEWATIAPLTGESRARALEKHSPEVYRTAIAETIARASR